MPNKKYLFQQKKRTFARKFFEKGLTASNYILFALKESGKGFLEELPSSYPGFALMKWMFGAGSGKNKKPEFKKEVLSVNLHRLKKQGLIAENPKKKVYYLTEEGEKLMAYVEDRRAVLKKPWDGKWRLVIFDLPVEKKRWRRWLRQELALLQFQMLQQSVYIGKCALPKSFYQEINEAGLGKCLYVLTIAEIDKKEEILKMFK